MISLDVMPTLLSIAGVNASNLDLDGVDLTQTLQNQTALSPRPLFWASLSNRGGRSEAMREGNWKLVVQHPKAKPGSFEHETIELFHLEDDPAETRNIAKSEPERTANMVNRLKLWYAETQKGATPQPGGW